MKIASEEIWLDGGEVFERDVANAVGAVDEGVYVEGFASGD